MNNPAAVNAILSRAVAHIQAKRYSAAVKELGAQAGAALQNPMGQNLLGGVYREQGKPQEALKAFDSAIRLAPHFPEAHFNRGSVLQELGRYDEALGALDRALFERPDYPLAQFGRGNVLIKLGRLEPAIEAFSHVIGLQPRFSEALFQRGRAYLELRQAENAFEDFRRVLALRKGDVPATVGLAKALSGLRRYNQAIDAAEKALAVEPKNIDALRLLVDVNSLLRNNDVAFASLQTIIGIQGINAELRSLEASLLVELRKFDEAIAVAQDAIRMAPDSPSGYVALARALIRTGRPKEQLEALHEAEKRSASGDEYHYARAEALDELHDFAGAQASFDRAVALNPDNASYHMARGMFRLGQGDYAAGFEEYEWRLQRRQYKHANFAEAAPRWRGEDLNGKRMMVFCEQGLGDTLQFLRYMPLVEARGGEVWLMPPRPLFDLVRQTLPNLKVVPSIPANEKFDFQTSLMSLAHVFGTTFQTVPATMPFRPEPETVAKWRERIGDTGFKVGIAWQGNPRFVHDHLRSIPLRHFAPLAEIPGVRLISLQAQNGLDQLEHLPAGMKVETLGEEIANNPDGFREIAGLAENLDLIITSDTGIAHFIGVLGHLQWIAVRDRPDWRWGNDGERTPWYPNMRIFRQETRGDWDDVFRRIAAALAEAAKTRPIG